MEGMKLPVALLFVVFAWSSWIDVNGLWVELPLLVNEYVSVSQSKSLALCFSVYASQSRI